MSKLSNALIMMQLLQNGKKYSLQELAEILEVSERMIRVYKEDLEKAGIYIDSIMGPYGGYVLNQTIRVPERKFKKKDCHLLDKYIANENNNDDREELLILKDKIQGIYIGSNKENIVLNLNNKILKIYNILTKGIKERLKVKIIYYSYDEGENERIICPGEMFLFQNGWYCAAYCELRNDIRHFELKRIIEIELLKEKY